MLLPEYINKLRRSGELSEYAASCKITASYLDRVLKKPYYRPKPGTMKALYQNSKGNVRKIDIDNHFSVIHARYK